MRWASGRSVGVDACTCVLHAWCLSMCVCVECVGGGEDGCCRGDVHVCMKVERRCRCVCDRCVRACASGACVQGMCMCECCE